MARVKTWRTRKRTLRGFNAFIHISLLYTSTVLISESEMAKYHVHTGEGLSSLLIMLVIRGVPTES